MKNLILIKLGGSVITDKSRPFCARPATIHRLAKEARSAQKALKNADFIIGHGSGSFAHTLAAKYQTQAGNINKNSLQGFCLTSQAAVDINRIVLREFLKEGIPAVSFSPMSGIYEEVIFLTPILKCLKLGLTPLLYGDVVFGGKKDFGIDSCERVLDILAGKLSRKYSNTRIIQVGDTDGVYDSEGKTILEITSKSFNKIKRWITGAKDADVTGGMLHKVTEGLNLARKYRIATIVTNGNKKGNLLKAILGEKVLSTRITS